MLRKILIIVLAVIVVIVLVNDIGRWISTRFTLTGITDEVSLVAARTTGGRDAAAIAAAGFATSQGVTLYAYDQTEQEVTVYTEMELKDTLVLGPFLSLLANRSYTVPYMMRIEDTAQRTP